MYPVPAHAQQIEREWAPELADYFGKSETDVLAKVPHWFEFPPGTLRVELMEGSTASLSTRALS